MRPRSKLLRLLVALVIGPTSVEGRGSCRVDAYGWKGVGVVNKFYIWYFRTCPECPPAHNGFLCKERFQVDIRGFSLE